MFIFNLKLNSKKIFGFDITENPFNCILTGDDDYMCAYMDCYGKDYVGDTSTTETGSSCKNWTSIPLSSYPGGGIGDHNFCRNPWPEKGVDQPWCYVSDDYEWQYCDVGDAQTSCLGRFLNRFTIFWKYYNYYF